ncbi:MAG TPA: protein translocase subunit SecDF [Candidatus Cryptobacteroides intestinipullorum]|nr:protein translocase subunit SecDF [Candidatus Cryptobacteroides intestinipullorum]
MQSKGAIRFVAILLVLACIWQLMFTVVTKIYENKAVKYAENAVEAFKASPAYEKIPDVDKAYVLDSIRKDQNRWYQDSISSQKVYFGYTFDDVREKEINLGLDLKGGMNVMLQVQLEDVMQALAENNTDPSYQKAFDIALERSKTSGTDFITLFEEAWQENANGQKLSNIFIGLDRKNKTENKKLESTDAEIISLIRKEAESAIANSFEVLRNRVDRFGVVQPNIQKVGNTGRILVELPGVKEPERVRKLLQGTASLEFWTTYETSEIFQYMTDANRLVAQIEKENADTEEAAPAAAPAASADTTDILAEELQAQAAESAEFANYEKENPLFAVLVPPVDQAGSVMRGATMGYAHFSDTAKVNKILNMPEVKALFPDDLIPMWSVKPFDNNQYELVAIKASLNGEAALRGERDQKFITDARVQYNGASPEVSMSMSAEAAKVWARLTKDNINRQIAIVLDNMVYSHPVVNTEITGGNSQISGNFTLEEAEDLVNVLKSGTLPAPAKIVQEQVVGPSLGAESINAGMISFVIAFLLVLAYMIFFYHGAGLIADAALLTNVLLLFGTLVSFSAVLTLPGIAGLVLTLGMAVDANVIIYERIKEELRSGKGLGKAVADGYSNAYSAIIDGQITTILTGIVLFIFGSGPVQGFATTLIIGIITSVFTSIFISRIIIDDRLAKGKNITFDNKLTRNFLQNTTVNFLSKRKYSYTISGLVIIVCIVSMCTKGFTYGVDFAGGRTYVVRFDQPVSVEDVRESLVKEFNGGIEVKQFGGESQMKITTQYMIEDKSSEADAAVEQKLFNAVKDFYAGDMNIDLFTSTAVNPNGIISSDKVDASIADDIKRDAIIAVIVALLVIFIYIAIRFKKWTWGLGGTVGLAHTAIIVVGFFSIFSGILPFSLDVDQSFIAAVLTIIGYAINDTVVIFDRIREYKTLHPKMPFDINANQALNSTLTRTMNTSLTTLIVMVAIAIFGGEVIRGMAVALCVGIAVGTYASIFIATPIMYDVTMYVQRRSEKKLAEKK